MVVVQQSTDAFAALNLCAGACWWWSSYQQVIVQPLVVSLAMVVLDVLLDEEA